MFAILKHKESLEWANNCLDNGKEYQTLDIINKHVKEVVQNTKPNVENALNAINEYLNDLQESIILLEQAVKSSGDTESKLKKDAQAKISSAIKILGTLDGCCKIMEEHKKNLE